MTHNATLRDAANRFVIGNVFDRWQVRPTSTRSGGMTKVYVPALHGGAGSSSERPRRPSAGPAGTSRGAGRSPSDTP
jgi:hypothetical protein